VTWFYEAGPRSESRSDDVEGVAWGVGERFEGVGFEEVAVAGDDEEVEWVAEVSRCEFAHGVGGDDGVGAAGACDDDADEVGVVVGESGGGDVGGHVLVAVALVGAGGVVADLDVEEYERMQAACAILGDGVEDAVGDVLAGVCVLERERGCFPEPVVLEAGEGCGGGFGGDAVDDRGVDAAVVCAESEVGVRRRDHGVAGGEERDGFRFGGVEDGVGVLFDVGALQDVDLDVVVGFEVVDGGAEEFARVELDERPVGVAEGVPALYRDGAFVVEPESDEREHTRSRGARALKASVARDCTIRRVWFVRFRGARLRVRGMEEPCVRVDRAAGEETRRALADAGALASDREIVVVDDDIFIPVSDRAAVPEGFDVVVRDVPEREIQRTPADVLGFEPSYERLGDVVILDEDDDERARAVADAIVASDLPVATVLNRASKVKGELRVRDWDVLVGESTETVHREYGCEYHLDVADVYFSPRLATERHRVTSQVEAGECVFDMFAGVGPFVIPAAKRGAQAVGVDLNPAAVEYMRENARRNGVADRVTAIEGDVRNVVASPSEEGIESDDVRDVASEYANWADRLVMNLPHSADEFLETAVALAGEACVLHYYDIQHEDDPFGPGERAIRAAAEPEYDVTVETRHVVRSYAPHEENVCLDVHLDST